MDEINNNIAEFSQDQDPDALDVCFDEGGARQTPPNT